MFQNTYVRAYSALVTIQSDSRWSVCILPFFPLMGSRGEEKRKDADARQRIDDGNNRKERLRGGKRGNGGDDNGDSNDDICATGLSHTTPSTSMSAALTLTWHCYSYHQNQS